MQRDAHRLAADGWRLRTWRIRGRGDDIDMAGLPASQTGPLAIWQPLGLAQVAREAIRFVLYVPLALVAWAWAAVAGRKPIEAAYERTDD